MFGLKKRTLQYIALGTGFLGLALGVFISSGKSIGSFIGGFASRVTNNYKITLDSSNKVTSAGDKVQHTALGNDVTFTYSGVSSSTSGHVTFNSGGTLVNKDHIRSITSFTAYFNTANALKWAVSYDGEKTNSLTVLESGRKYDIGTSPYYLHLSATATVTLTSLEIEYSCIENPACHEGETTGTGLIGVIDFWNANKASDGQTSTLVNLDYVQARSFDTDDTSTRQSKTLISGVSNSGTYTYQDRYGGIGLSSGSYAADIVFTLASGIDVSSVTVIAGSQSPTKTLILNNNSQSVSANCSGITALNDTYTNTLTWNFQESPTELEFETASKSSKLAIYRIYLYGATGPNIPTPEEEIIGFSAVDNNVSSYYNDSVYDTANGLHVVANYTGGTNQVIDKGGENGYSYVVRNAQGVAINTAQAFGTEGVYTAYISYKNFIPVEIEFTVSFRVSLIGITVNSEKLSFTTAEKLSDFTSGISADLTYNKESENEVGVPYSSFASKNLSLTLSNPNGQVANISTVFGTAGQWTIRVSSTENAGIYGQLSITVNAIQVTSISVTGSTATIEEGKTVQLTASVEPATATNQSLSWSSNQISVATVSDSGLVTGVGVGEARITATAQDGSAVYGYIDITVIAKQAAADEGTYLLSNSSTLEIGSYVVFTSSVSDGDGYAMSKTQNTNNRPGVAVEVDNGTIERTSSSSFAAFRVEEGTTSGSYSFYDENAQGYIYAAGGGNYLRTQPEKNDNASFTISGSTEKTITTVASVTQSILRWNSTSTLFSCYGSTSSVKGVPYIYEKAGDPVYPNAISITGGSSVSVGGTTTLSVTYTPSDTTVKNVTWSSSDDTVAGVENGVVTGIKAGTVTITATATGEGGTSITATKSITVSNVSVSSVSLNKNSTSISAGGTETLVATISPAEATNKNVTWSTSDNSVATVDGGVVTGVAAGKATITVTTVDGGKTATCTVTVTSSAASSTETTTYTFNTKSWGASPANWTSGQAGNQFTNGQGIQVTKGASGANGTSPVSFSNVSSVVVTYCTNSSSGVGSITVSVGGEQIGSQSVTTSGGTTGRDMTFDASGKTGKVKIEVTCTTNSIYIASCAITCGASTPTDPTSISITPSSFELSANGSKTMSVSYLPTSANQNKAVTWTSSNTNVATVDSSGKVTATSTATVGQSATITARLTNITSISATATVTIVETAKADHTVMIYICGADLESNSSNRLATGDIQEMLSVSGQPTDVNVVIETGGAKSWASTYGISSQYLQRHHIANRKLVTDESNITYASMGLESTLQSFIEYGISNYPANRYGLVLWNHGGGMRGVCYDEKRNDDNLLDYEVKNAVSNALNNSGMSGQKLEWIGYDACLMQVQDIAEMNSPYFNYMIASEESEAGYGWDYDTWLDDLYAKKTTPNILKAIVDGFIKDNGGTNDSDNDQTLSYLNLSYASAYKTAWENMASQLSNKLNGSNKSSFNTLVKSCKYYADTDYTTYGLFDAKDFINKLSSNSTFNPGSTYTNAVLTAHGNFVAYSSCGNGAGNSYGVCMYWSVSSNSGKSTYYTSSHTNFSNWRSIVSTYGS